MVSKSDVRSLTALVSSASTARVLNLAKRDPAIREATPLERRLFQNAGLDRALLVKHKLRLHERDWFVAPKSLATKVLIPIDPGDLRFGACAVMVDQKGYDEVLVQSIGIDKNPEDGAHDRAILLALNDLPSLDPFLTREHLARKGFRVADDYFDISPADVARMTDFVKKDILPLVSLCFGAAAGQHQVEIFSQKLLSAELDASMDPLRMTLKMDAEQFVEGVFCWKGFLYYKWVLKEVNNSVSALTIALNEVEGVGDAKPEELVYISGARGRIKTAVKEACREVQLTLLNYDLAFEKLTKKADPGSFRDFLLAAPKMFFDVGEKLGAVQHITSFWNFRFAGRGGAMTMPVIELFDVFTDFENSLGTPDAIGQTWAA